MIINLGFKLECLVNQNIIFKEFALIFIMPILWLYFLLNIYYEITL